jgi:hypothetical protein
MCVPLDAEFDIVSVNRQIKDGVFRLLFDNPENAAELYYALTGDRCSPDEIIIITITTTISGELKNDLAFVVKGKILVIGEHMSSPYANMPVRLLMYTGILYEKLIKMKDEEKFLYSGKLYKIPTPAFVVFYNGTKNRPEKEILRLSTAFENEADNDFGFLELEVPVYNINRDMNEELFSKSPNLKQYAEFIAKLREFSKLYNDYAQAVREAVNHCIANDILAEFLKEQGGRIVSLLSTYDPEVAKRVYAEEYAEERTLEIARDLLETNLSLDEISRITRLSHEELERIRNT